MATNADIFPDAVEVGDDRDYSKMYVARWFFQELMYPVKFIPDREEAIICQDGPEHKVTMVHVLRGDNYIWQKATSEDVYVKAVYTGYTMDGDILFVGRGYHDDVLCVGLVSLAHKALIAPYGGKVIGIEDFEVLIRI
uniref:Uncharacterized protein n=1 Tax=Stomoxys calcitrans TaxID=35570 RepID=A0A1I8Q7U2_STOCA